MSQEVLFASVVAITISSGFAATIVSLKADGHRSHMSLSDWHKLRWSAPVLSWRSLAGLRVNEAIGMSDK